MKKIVQDGKSALVTQGGLHVLITDILLYCFQSEFVRVQLYGGLDCWTGLVDWTSGLDW